MSRVKVRGLSGAGGNRGWSGGRRGGRVWGLFEEARSGIVRGVRVGTVWVEGIRPELGRDVGGGGLHGAGVVSRVGPTL